MLCFCCKSFYWEDLCWWKVLIIPCTKTSYLCINFSNLSDTYLFVCCLTSKLRIFHSSTTSLFSMRGFKMLIYAWHMWHWSKYWLLLHNTCCNTKPRWLWSHLKDRPNFFTIFAKHGILSIYAIRDHHGTTDNEKYSEVWEKILPLTNMKVCLIRCKAKKLGFFSFWLWCISHLTD